MAKKALIAPVTEIIQRIGTCRKWVGTRAEEWSLGIQMLWLILISGRHGLLIGPPGIAKSQVIDDTVRCIGGKLFSIQMHPRMKETALTGEVNIEEYGRTGQIKYDIAGYLTDSDIGHLEEIFLGNAGALFTLMKMMTRGQIRLGRDTINAAPIIIGDSNDMPDVLHANDVDTKTLAAFRDRFECGMVLHSFVRGSVARKRMAKSRVDRRRMLEAPPTSITMEELGHLRETCWDMAENIPDPIIDRLLKMVDGLRKNGILIYERRWMWAREILAAHALLNGRTEITDQDLKTVRFWGWSAPAQLPVVFDVLRQFVPSAAPILLAEETACDKIFATLMATDFRSDNRAKHQKGTEVSAKISDSQRTLSKLIEKHPDEIDEIEPVVDKLKAYNRQINRDILGIDLGDS